MAEKNTSTDKKANGKKIPALHIKALSQNGFRRCGLAFTHEGALYAKDLFTDNEVARLKSERLLSVIETEVDEADLIDTEQGIN